jgi:predicted amidohydrolase YtcJ
MRLQRSTPWLVAVCLLPACAGSPATTDRADLVLRGGRIVTLDSDRPEATALAARDGRIVAVGADEGVSDWIGPDSRVIELDGRLAVPGLIEGHGHFASLGRSARILRLARYRTWDEIVAAVAEAAADAPAGTWIFGRGWHQEKWDATPEPQVEGFPVHSGLSRVSPENPVVLGHASGHASMVNAAAMAAAGIDRDTPDPEGGEILHDDTGEPTGLLRESASRLVGDAYKIAEAELPAEVVEAEKRHDIEAAAVEALSKGITSFQDAGTKLEDLDRIAGMASDGGLGIRLWVMIRDLPEKMLAADLAAMRRVDADGWYTVRALKVVGDGALGSRGAWLLEPYSDLPGHTGLAVTDPSIVRQIAERALEHDFQLCVHAIGDRANRESLDIFEEAITAGADRGELRWRIEHAQHLHPDDVERFAGLGVIAAMQGVHCTSDAPWIEPRLGEERAESGAYLWRSLIDSGAVVVNGTDAPVEDVDPIASYYASVSRRLADGTRFYPDQAMTRMEALESYTIDAAYGAFEEGEKGSLEIGKLADVTVLSKDILTVAEEEIPSTRVELTIVGGVVRYEIGEGLRR